MHSPTIRHAAPLAWLLVAILAAVAAAEQTDWGPVLAKPAHWYASDEARRIADNILLYQRDNGGWPKEANQIAPLTPGQATAVRRRKGQTDTTIDNRTTTSQLRFLARLITRTDGPARRYRRGFLRGLRFLLEAQYPNGGWPQYYPLREDYSRHITYNDDAMIEVLLLLRGVAEGQTPFRFTDPALGQACHEAFADGIRCILQTQVRADGRLTAWCAQHHCDTMEPVRARSYELPSLSGHESVRIVQLLMTLEEPPPEVIRAVQSAVAWFDRARIEGIDTKRIVNDRGEPDVIVVRDESAAPIWARFYEIATNRPIFSGRDGIKKYLMKQIERERRVGYKWYTRRPLGLLRNDYPRWQRQHTPHHDVLADPSSSAGRETSRAGSDGFDQAGLDHGADAIGPRVSAHADRQLLDRAATDGLGADVDGRRRRVEPQQVRPLIVARHEIERVGAAGGLALRMQRAHERNDLTVLGHEHAGRARLPRE